VSKGLESSAPVEKSRGPIHKPAPRGNSGPSLGHVSGEVRVHPAGPAAAGSGINLVMNDSTRCDGKRCGGGGSGGRDLALVGFLRFLDHCLYKWMRYMEGQRGREGYPYALYCLNDIIEEVDRTASKYDCPVEHIGESRVIGMTLCLEEQRLGENSSGAHAPPSSEGDKTESSAGFPATTCKDVATQTRAATLVSVAVGGSPTGTVDVGV